MTCIFSLMGDYDSKSSYRCDMYTRRSTKMIRRLQKNVYYVVDNFVTHTFTKLMRSFLDTHAAVTRSNTDVTRAFPQPIRISLTLSVRKREKIFKIMQTCLMWKTIHTATCSIPANICMTFLHGGSTSSTLAQHCTNVIQMFCVCWDMCRLRTSPCDSYGETRCLAMRHGF